MPVVAEVVNVTASPTVLAKGGGTVQDLSVVVVRNDSAVDVFLGGADVTTATGMRLPTTTPITLDLAPADTLYGIVASGTQPVQVLRTRQ